MKNEGWHLDVQGYDCTPWWNEPGAQNEVTRESAYYELLRRHPQLRGPMLKWHAADCCGLCGKEITSWILAEHCHAQGYASSLIGGSTLVNVLAVIGCNAWTELTTEDKDAFIETLRKSDVGLGNSRSASIKTLVNPAKLASSVDRLTWSRRQAEDFADAVRPDKSGKGVVRTFEPAGKNVFGSLKAAVEGGKLVLAIDLTSETPKTDAKALADTYLKLHSEFAPVREKAKRTRWDSWLGLIAEFDLAERQRRQRKEPLKAIRMISDRFRKLLNKLCLK